MNMEINGIDRVCLRDSGSSIDVCSRSWINEDDLLGEYVWLKSPLDEICHCLPLAKIKIKTKKGEIYTKAAIKQDSSDNDLYLLGNRTAELLEDVKEFVKTCDSCQRVGKPRDKAKAPLKLVPIISEVFSKINIDAVGPLPVSTKQNRYLITSICVASKYPEAIPVESITSPNVIDALLSIFSRIGFPREIQSDLGTSFTSELTTTFFNKFGIKVTRSSVSHLQSNAGERVHRTIKRVIKALCVESGEDWEGVLPLALFSLRTVAHESTGFSPTELVMGKNLRTPQTLVYEEWMEEGKHESIVENPNKDPRPCVDYRRLNEITRAEFFPLPNMEEIVEKSECGSLCNGDGFVERLLSDSAHAESSEIRSFRYSIWHLYSQENDVRVSMCALLFLQIDGPSFRRCCMKGNTRNRWRDGPVCPAADKELWRLGPDSSGVFWRVMSQ
ncbi:retrovirus-related Pol polyprotein from transposon 297 [Trichonephila clavipes]|nr:retrovirus-related Pol polyprotein from transposon 297 [Trichonephila clavipes]